MIKKTSLFLFLVIFSAGFLFNIVKAADTVSTDSASSTTSAEINNKEINDLKLKVATKVDELRKKNQRAVAGIVEKISVSTIDIVDSDGVKWQFVIDDSLTKFYQITGASKKEITKDVLKKNNFLIASGPIIDQKVSANVIYLDTQYIVNSGKVTDINKDNYYINIVTVDKDNYTLDIETATKLQILNTKSLAVEPAGFSKFKSGDIVHFVIKSGSVAGKDNRYSADKILIIPQEFFLKP